MLIPEALKLNRFRNVVIPKAKDIFNSYRMRNQLSVPAPNQFSGDEMVIPDANKTETAQMLIDDLPEEEEK